MLMIQYLLEHLNTFFFGFLMITGYALIAVGGLLIVRKYFPDYKFKNHNDVAGFIFANLGVIYAVLLAFLVIVSWENFREAATTTGQEANSIASLYRDSATFPENVHNQIEDSLRSYATAIIKDEWPIMTRARSAKVQEEEKRLWRVYGSIKPENETQKIFLAESVKKLNEAVELRRQRIHQAHEGIHPMLYFVLIAGGLITISFTMFFGSENFVPQVIMTSLLAVMIALTTFTIIVLDYPFSGDISISPEVFETILSSLLSPG